MPQKKRVSFNPQLAQKQVVFQSYLDRDKDKRKPVEGLKGKARLESEKYKQKRKRGAPKREATQAICKKLGVDKAMTNLDFARQVNKWLLAQKKNFLIEKRSDFIKYTARAAENDSQGKKELKNMHRQFLRLERTAQTCLSFRELPKSYMDDGYRFENIMQRIAKPKIKIKVPPQKPLVAAMNPSFQCRAKCKCTGKQCKNKIGRGCRKYCKTHSTIRGT